VAFNDIIKLIFIIIIEQQPNDVNIYYGRINTNYGTYVVMRLMRDINFMFHV